MIVPGRIFKAATAPYLDFDDSDTSPINRVALGSIASTDPLSLAGSQWSVFCYIYKASSRGTDFQRIIDKSSAGNGADGWVVLVDHLKLGIITNKNGGYTTNNAISLTTQHFLIFESNASSWKIYVDGSEVSFTATAGSHAAPPSVTTNAAIADWNHSATNRRWDGRLWHIGVLNRVLSAAERTYYRYHRPTGRESGLVSYWPFLDGSGSTLKDWSNNANNGTITGATWG